MAEAWLARQDGPGGFSKRVVIKKILPHLAGDHDFVDMFLQEARLAAGLNHPNVVQIFDLGEVDGVFFLVMEYVEGKSLRWIQQRARGSARGPPDDVPGCLGIGFVAAVLAGACAGLHHAHELRSPGGERLGLVHRDVAPDNLLVSYDGIPKVIDFGIAKARGEHDNTTRSGLVKGKSGYMSPEQVRGFPLDCRSDVYSIGVVLFELLSGRRPFTGSAVDVMRAIATVPAPALEGVRPGLPPAVGVLVARCLAKDPAQRPQSAGEVEQELVTLARAEGFDTSEVADTVRRLCAEDGAPPAREAQVGQGLLPSAFAVSEQGPALLPHGGPLQETASESSAISQINELPGAGTIDERGRVELSPTRLAPPQRELQQSTIDRFSDLSAPLELAYEPLPAAAEAPQVTRSPPFDWSRAALLGLLVVLIVTGVVALHWLVQLAPTPGVQLTLESQPPGAEVWLDGFPLGKVTPTTLDWDNQIAHELLFKHAGRAHLRQTVAAGQPSGTLAVVLGEVGRVSVVTSPPGAEVTCDGESLGVAPRTFELLADRSEKLTVSLPGYLDSSTVVTVGIGNVVLWAPGLQPAATLVVTSDPPGATVSFDSALMGRTPLQLQIEAYATHVVSVTAPGLDAFKTLLHVLPGATKSLTVSLRDPKQIRLRSSLAGVTRKLTAAKSQLAGLEHTHPIDHFAAMATLHRRDVAERVVEGLEQQRDQLEAQIEERRTEVEDRTEAPANP